jgi:hypothetical protein
MKKFKVEEDGEGGGDGGIGVGDIGSGDTGMNTTDLLAGGSGDQTQLGVLGIANFNFPTRLGKIKKRLLDQYALLKK